jgi:hypothetical protein
MRLLGFFPVRKGRVPLSERLTISAWWEYSVSGTLSEIMVTAFLKLYVRFSGIEVDRRTSQCTPLLSVHHAPARA